MNDLRVRAAAPGGHDAVPASRRTGAEGTGISDDRDGAERLVARDQEALIRPLGGTARPDGRIRRRAQRGPTGGAATRTGRRSPPGPGGVPLAAPGERSVRPGGPRGDAVVPGRDELAEHPGRAAGYAPEPRWSRRVEPPADTAGARNPPPDH
ncbi:GNAT family N-acetyltransferase [Streptomyces sp. NPDC050856]|uniref:GNAT family N-acetyltransferase n=1 Tax=Streptomyces sp. NPDC050856 TaxID=3154939 RepID=UPI0033CEAC27